MEQLSKLYRSFVNDFITLGRFAEAHNLEVEDAETLLKLSKKYHEKKVELLSEDKQLDAIDRTNRSNLTTTN